MIEGIIHCLQLATVFGGIALILGVIFWGAKLSKGVGTRKGREMLTEEARIMQEMYIGLSKMEERVEALETILLDYRRKDVKDESK